jgi:hypothetical protein
MLGSCGITSKSRGVMLPILHKCSANPIRLMVGIEQLFSIDAVEILDRILEKEKK